MLYEVNKEHEGRGYCFARSADGYNVIFCKRNSGEQVIALVKRLYAKLQLRINESKSALANTYDRKFFGYSFWAAKGKVVKLREADKLERLTSTA